MAHRSTCREALVSDCAQGDKARQHGLGRCSSSGRDDPATLVFSIAEFEARAAGKTVWVCDGRVPSAQAIVDAPNRGRRRACPSRMLTCGESGTTGQAASPRV